MGIPQGTGSLHRSKGFTRLTRYTTTSVHIRSDDSANWRRKDAEGRLRDFGETADSAARPAAGAPLLPAPLDVLQAGGRPAFLDPEATRPLAQPVHRNRPVR